MRVLLIVDLQNDFCPGGSLAVSGGDLIVPIVNGLITNGGFDHIVASKDWHPANHISFAASHENHNPFDVIFINGLEQRLWPVHGVEGTYGAEIHPDLHVEQIDQYICKGTDPEIDSYSAFFDNAHQRSTGLMEWLIEQATARGETQKDIELTAVGLATDYCVKFSALDAAILGLKTTVVCDACRAVNAVPDAEQEALSEMRKAGITIVHSGEIVPSMKESVPRPLLEELKRGRKAGIQLA